MGGASRCNQRVDEGASGDLILTNYSEKLGQSATPKLTY